MTVQWRPDILGDEFECTDIDLGADAEGPLVATLVRALPEPRNWWQRLLRSAPLNQPDLSHVDILYVHGWSDYFFQTPLARYWTARGARFYALDLRKYGRSLRPGQTPGYVESLSEYDAEISRATEIMRAEAAGESDRELVLLGHSTGGLVLSLWAADHPGLASALILNSPWLEFQLSALARKLMMPIMNMSAWIAPREASPQFDFGYYSRAQREVGPAEVLDRLNHEWRPDKSHAVYSGWLRAVLAGHERVEKGLQLTIPVCVLMSDHDEAPLRWSDALTTADTVLSVKAVASAATRLGRTVTIERIPNALHDVFLSRADARAEAYARLNSWVTGWRAS